MDDRIAEFGWLLDGLGEALGERCQPIETRLRELETYSVRFRGVFRPEEFYSRGSIVLSGDRGVYCALRDNHIGHPPPGTNEEHWVTIVSSPDGRKTTELHNRIEKLEQKIAAMERDGLTKYCGVFNRATHYTRGSFTTHAGSLWFAAEDTCNSTPGNSDSWVLAVKSAMR